MDIANFELSEEEQARLLEEYEQEIKEREKNNKDDSIEIPVDDVVPNKAKIQKPAKKSNVQSKPTAGASTKGKINKDLKTQQHQQKSTQQQKPSAKNPENKTKTNKKNEALPIEKDHFKKESESSTSDESWEKDFDM